MSWELTRRRISRSVNEKYLFGRIVSTARTPTTKVPVPNWLDSSAIICLHSSYLQAAPLLDPMQVLTNRPHCFCCALPDI
ncbi:hypothetical protein VFPPC_18271 [Pochonia chlamydosporia 170]|uniref:Uncharacterized protein n=1 Tax=Pochonia chlamydosporia 170 TaxID=1380566 RepID=A0A219APB6_METCM|nr:hypothetical protein VFPPC_18271 [Pochonia chlamydosporia 170]OWT42603.1 hypothetical protein VFPPC_18271 [Pochonia chlamydosporia 170]